MSHCIYNTPDDVAPFKSASLLIRLARESESETGALTRHIDSIKRNLEAEGEEFNFLIIEELGNGALWVEDSKQLTVFRGADMFIFNTYSRESEGREKIEALAREIFSRLKT